MDICLFLFLSSQKCFFFSMCKFSTSFKVLAYPPQSLPLRLMAFRCYCWCSQLRDIFYVFYLVLLDSLIIFPVDLFLVFPSICLFQRLELKLGCSLMWALHQELTVNRCPVHTGRYNGWDITDKSYTRLKYYNDAEVLCVGRLTIG